MERLGGGVISLFWRVKPATPQKMKPTTHSDVRSILIVKADRIYAEALRLFIRKAFPQAKIRIECSLELAAVALAKEPVELLVTGIGASLGGDAIDFLSTCTGRDSRARQVLVVTTHHEVRLLTALRTLPIRGVFDSTEESPDQLTAALQLVARGDFTGARVCSGASGRMSPPACPICGC